MTITSQLPGVKRGQKKLNLLNRAEKDAVLLKLAKLIGKNELLIQEKNQLDLAALPADTLASYRDRLTLTPLRIKSLLDSIQAIIRLDDPIGRIEADDYRADLHFQKVSAPIGMIFIIFESRPNVAVDAFCLAFKSGNATVLRGGSEAIHTLSTLYMLIKQALTDSGHWSHDQLPFLGVETYDRAVIQELLSTEHLDLIIPRGERD